MRTGIVVASICMAAGCAQGAPSTLQPASPGAAENPYLRPQRLVDMGGRQMNLYCLGHGQPPVVFAGRLSSTTITWHKVQPAVARQVRACSYDRAGLGFSDESPRPGTSANIVDDLHTLLRAAGEKPP